MQFFVCSKKLEKDEFKIFKLKTLKNLNFIFVASLKKESKSLFTSKVCFQEMRDKPLRLCRHFGPSFICWKHSWWERRFLRLSKLAMKMEFEFFECFEFEKLKLVFFEMKNYIHVFWSLLTLQNSVFFTQNFIRYFGWLKILTQSLKLMKNFTRYLWVAKTFAADFDEWNISFQNFHW